MNKARQFCAGLCSARAASSSEGIRSERAASRPVHTEGGQVPCPGSATGLRVC